MRAQALVIASALGFVLCGAAQNTHIDIAVGVQEIDVSGNTEAFRSQVNEDDGAYLGHFKLLTLDLEDPGFAERILVTADGFGARPDGQFRLEATKARQYRLQVKYRERQLFDGSGNYGLPDSVLGWHRFERESSSASIELELMPGRAITPLLAYRHFEMESELASTRHLGEGEFSIFDRADRNEDEIEAGIAFRGGSWSGSVRHSVREIDEERHLGLAPGAGSGLDDWTFLGVDPTLYSLTTTERLDAESAATRADIRGSFGKNLRLSGSFAASTRDADLAGFETANGDLVSFAVSRFFHGFEESQATGVEEESWAGRLNLSAELGAIDLDVGFDAGRRDVDAFGTLRRLYADTSDFGSNSRQDIELFWAIDRALDRSRRGASLRISSNDGPVDVWAEVAVHDEDLEVHADTVEIILPWGQEIDQKRSIDTVSAGLGKRYGPFSASLEWRHDEADIVLLRTDFTSRERLALRTTLDIGESLQVDASFDDEQSDSVQPGLVSDWQTRHWGLGLSADLHDRVVLHTGFDRFDGESAFSLIRPETLQLEASSFADTTDVAEIGLMVDFDRLSFDFGHSALQTTGSIELDFERSWLRSEFEISKAISAIFELDSWTSENLQAAELDYDADRYAFLLRWRR